MKTIIRVFIRCLNEGLNKGWDFHEVDTLAAILSRVHKGISISRSVSLVTIFKRHPTLFLRSFPAFMCLTDSLTRHRHFAGHMLQVMLFAP